MPVPIRTVVGTATAQNATSISLAGVSVSAGERLVVIFAVSDSSGFLFSDSASFNGVPLVEANVDGTNNVPVQGSIFISDNLTAQTGTVTVTFSPQRACAVLLVTKWFNLRPGVPILQGNTGGDFQGDLSFQYSVVNFPSLLLGALLSDNLSGDTRATWDSPLTGGLRAAVTNGAVHLCAEDAYGSSGGTGPVIIRASGYTPSNSVIMGNELPSRSTSLGGYTSYDIGRFNDGSPEATILPEAAARVARGDHRYAGGQV
jgi:hypothetical protein